MLQSWIALAEKYSIKWFLSDGGLIGREDLSFAFFFFKYIVAHSPAHLFPPLGSARHMGFVPYDWDLDVILFPDSLEDFVRSLLTEEATLPIFLARDYDSKYIRIDEQSKVYSVELPSNVEEIPSVFKEGCKEGPCWAEVEPVAKIRHKRSCYGLPWTGGYAVNVFLLSPPDTPELTTCVVEEMSVPCPVDIEGWLRREVGDDWLIPHDILNSTNIMKASNPFLSCADIQ